MTRHLDRPGTGGESAPLIPLPAAAGQYRTEDGAPTTVATIAVIGASTIYGLGWLTLLLFPLIAVVQSIATRVGVAGRADLQTAVTRTRGPAARWSLLISIVAVNIVTIAADLEGGASAWRNSPETSGIDHESWKRAGS